MVVRIVKMTFNADKVDQFLFLFNKNKSLIRNQEGCQHLELLNDVDSPNIFFTYSYWDDPKFLDQYRKSELFGKVWPETKALFAEKPEAWTVEQRVVLE